MTSHNELKQLFVQNTGRTFTVSQCKKYDNGIYGYQPSRNKHYVWQEM